MLSFLKRKIRKHIQKRTFSEYGYRVKTFALPEYGTVDYAQWLHPFESEKQISADQVRFFAQLIGSGRFAIDIGAHTGDTTVPMAVAIGATGTILALEPNPYVFKILEKNAGLNPTHGKIIPIPYAATVQPGSFTFHYSDASFCNGGFLEKIKNQKHNHQYTLAVEGINLESYLAKHHAERLPELTLVKVDAEGYDKEILKSIAGLLRAHRPRVMAECYKKLTAQERHELYAVLDELGYQLFKIDSFDNLASAELLDPELMQRYKHFEILALPTNDPLLATLHTPDRGAPR